MPPPDSRGVGHATVGFAWHQPCPVLIRVASVLDPRRADTESIHVHIVFTWGGLIELRLARTMYRMKELATYIRDRRIEQSMTQDELAHALGINRQMVSHWEGGTRAVAPPHRPALAALLGVTVGDLESRMIEGPRVTLHKNLRGHGRKRPPYPMGATLDQMLRLGPFAGRAHREAKRRLSQDEFQRLVEEFPRDTPHELLLAFYFAMMGTRLVWTSPRLAGCPMMVLDDFLLEYGGDQMQWALVWEGDRESVVVFGQVHVRSAWSKASYRVDFLVYHKQEGRPGQWLYIELDGGQHPSQPSQDTERAENLLVPELRYDNQKLASLDWLSRVFHDIRNKAAAGERSERARRKSARQRRLEREAQAALRRAA